MKKINLIFLSFLFLFFIFLQKKSAPFLNSPTLLSSPTSLLSLQQLPDHDLIKADLGQAKNLKLEIVNTPESIAQGLSGRDKLGADGMLFILPTSSQPQFWMKEMKFDLDLVWFQDLRVVEITPAVPAPKPGALPSELPLYSPAQKVDLVLELPAGSVAELGLKPGLKLEAN